MNTSSATVQKNIYVEKRNVFLYSRPSQECEHNTETANDLILGFFMKLAECALPIPLPACNENKTMYM